MLTEELNVGKVGEEECAKQHHYVISNFVFVICNYRGFIIIIILNGSSLVGVEIGLAESFLSMGI